MGRPPARLNVQDPADGARRKLPMTHYAYSIDDKNPADISVRIFVGADKALQVAVAKIVDFSSIPRFESYATSEGYRSKGLSYALTHLMLLYCNDKGKGAARVENAHWPLMISLQQLGFAKTSERRDPTFKNKAAPQLNTADFACANIPATLAACKQKMLQRGLIEDGLRNIGPYQWVR
jgi:hypothetical protein